MSAGALARRYAKALLESAIEQNQVEQIAKDLESLANNWNESRELREVFQNPAFDTDARRKVIETIVQRAGVSPMLKNVLWMLSDRQRMRHLPEIAEAFAAAAQLREGSVRAEVIAAAPLSDAYYEELRRTLETATGKKVQLVKKVDPTLIAGVVTRVGDRVFDGSVKNRLAELEDELLGLNH